MARRAVSLGQMIRPVADHWREWRAAGGHVGAGLYTVVRRCVWYEATATTRPRQREGARTHCPQRRKEAARQVRRNLSPLEVK